MKNMKRLILSCLLLPVLLAACGGGTSRQVELADFAFEPGGMTVKAGQTVELTLENTGAVEHNFVILGEGVEVTESWDSGLSGQILFQHLHVGPGTATAASFKAPMAPGTYQFLCTVPSHFELGMHGVLTVTE